MVSGKKYWSDNSAVAGQQFEYGFDDIGNRKTTKAGGDSAGTNLRAASYSANALNQYTARTVPGFVDILGNAHSNATVTVNLQPTSRRGMFFRKELALNNSVSPVYQSITNVAVLINGTSNNIVVTNIGSAFLPQTPEAFTYDADGNLLSDGRWTYTWDAENRLIQMMGLNTLPDAAKRKLVFAYDWQGRRVNKKVYTWNAGAWILDSELKFVYDGWNLIAVLSPSFQLQSSFSWGLDLSGSLQGAGGVGGLLAVNAGASGTHFAAFDGNGNLSALVNANDGTNSATYEFGPFGELLRSTGPMAKVNPFRFSTKYQDNESGLLYYGYRYYNPSTGRWLSRAPIQEKGGANLYGLVGNDGINKVDYLGLSGNDVLKIWATFTRTMTDFCNRCIRCDLPSGLKNVPVSVPPWSSYKGCTWQSEAMANNLETALHQPASNTDSTWTFDTKNLGAKIGSGGHNWVEARSTDPADPIIFLDTWSGCIEAIFPSLPAANWKKCYKCDPQCIAKKGCYLLLGDPSIWNRPWEPVWP